MASWKTTALLSTRNYPKLSFFAHKHENSHHEFRGSLEHMHECLVPSCGVVHLKKPGKLHEIHVQGRTSVDPCRGDAYHLQASHFMRCIKCHFDKFSSIKRPKCERSELWRSKEQKKAWLQFSPSYLANYRYFM